MTGAPLQGWRVVVTRAESEDGALSAALRRQGADPLHCPVLQVSAPDDVADLKDALARLPETDWLILTSPRAVEALDELGVFGGPPPEGLQIAVVGTRTAEVLAEAGWHADLVPEPAGAIPLLLAMEARGVGRGHRVLFPASERARTVLPDGLRERGARVYQVVAYRPTAARLDAHRLELLSQADALTFTSPSAVEAMVDCLSDDDLARLRELPVGVQGPTTGRAATEAGWSRVIEAEPRSFEGLAATLARELGSEPALTHSPVTS